MNETNKILLAQKKAQQQLTLNIKNWLPNWLPIFNAVRALNIPWSFEYFDCVNPTAIPFWEAAIQHLLKDLPIPISSIKTPDEHYVHLKMQELYPSQNALRYSPALTNNVHYEAKSAAILAQAAQTLNIKAEEEVFLFYTRFTPVLRLPYSCIALLNEEELMMPENLCIMPLNYSWLIFRSLENEWLWGKLKSLI